MDEQHRNFTGFQHIQGGNSLIIKTGLPLHCQFRQVHQRERREPELEVKDMSENIVRACKAAVGDNSSHIGREVESGRHEHCGTAHGNPGQVQVTVTSKSAHRIIGPHFAVIPFFYTKTDIFSIAFRMASLVGHQQMISLIMIKLIQAGKIRKAVTAVAVHEQKDVPAFLFRRKQISGQLQAVIAGKRYLLRILFLEPARSFLHLIPETAKGKAFSFLRSCRCFLPFFLFLLFLHPYDRIGEEKRHAAGYCGNGKHNCRCYHSCFFSVQFLLPPSICFCSLFSFSVARAFSAGNLLAKLPSFKVFLWYSV